MRTRSAWCCFCPFSRAVFSSANFCSRASTSVRRAHHLADKLLLPRHDDPVLLVDDAAFPIELLPARFQFRLLLGHVQADGVETHGFRLVFVLPALETERGTADGLAHLGQFFAFLAETVVQLLLELFQVLPPGEYFFRVSRRLFAAGGDLAPQPFQLLLPHAPGLLAAFENAAHRGEVLLLPAQATRRFFKVLRLTPAFGLDLGAARRPDVALGLERLTVFLDCRRACFDLTGFFPQTLLPLFELPAVFLKFGRACFDLAGLLLQPLLLLFELSVVFLKFGRACLDLVSFLLQPLLPLLKVPNNICLLRVGRRQSGWGDLHDDLGRSHRDLVAGVERGRSDGSAIDGDRLDGCESADAGAVSMADDEAQDRRQIGTGQAEVAPRHAADEEAAVAHLVECGTVGARAHFQAHDRQSGCRGVWSRRGNDRGHRHTGNPRRVGNPSTGRGPSGDLRRIGTDSHDFEKAK